MTTAQYFHPATDDVDASSIVTLPQGRLVGSHTQGVRRYVGIPYAMPPLDEWRFQAPRPLSEPMPQVDSGLAEMPPLQRAQTFGQAPLQMIELGGGRWRREGGLDCLTLNIWLPDAPPSDAPLPVMVWIPGGGYIRGSASQPLYDGTTLARQGMVFVSVNYRIGVDGFLDIEGATPNRGLLDILCALAWIRTHIAAFGGDPANITLAGQSAGAGAIVMLMRMRAAQGLFRQAILQSPSTLGFSAQDAEIARQAICTLAGCEPRLDALASADPSRLAEAVARLSASAALRSTHGFAPRHRFALRPLVQPLQTEDDTAVQPDIQWWPERLLVGANREEARLYLVPDGEIHRITEGMLQAALEDMQVDATQMQQLALDWPGGAVTPGDRLCAAQTEFLYAAPARDLAMQAACAGVTVYRYQFAWRSPGYGNQLGAAHGVELPFVFHTWHTVQGRLFTGEAPPQSLAQVMLTAWQRFVREGDCGWPALQPGSDTPFRLFDDA